MDDSKGRFEMNWFKIERNDVAPAADGQPALNALDRLTQSAAVAVSRRGFLKKLGAGAAVGIGMTALASAAQAAGGGCPPTKYECVSCGGGRIQSKTTTYSFNGSTCVASVTYGTCGNCPQ
jgi:hypothetical protein